MLSDLQSTPDRRPNPPQSRSPGAERMARHRQRRRKGLHCLFVELRTKEIAALTRHGYLDAAHLRNKYAVLKALYDFLDDTLR
jgi:hypothetical protein